MMDRVFCKSIIVCLTAVSSVVIALNLLTPVVYRSLPNDYVRTGIILNHIGKSESAPDVVVLGNSRGMSGVDGKLLSELTGLKVENYCSPSQTLIESALYYDRLPKSVKTVIQCIDEKEFSDKAMKMTVPATVAFSMSNYSIGSFERSLLSLEDAAELEHSRIIRNFKARSSYKTGISNLIVKMLDDDAPSDQIKDLKHPYMYPSDHSKTYERDLEHLRQWIPSATSTFVLSEDLSSFCSMLTRHMYDKGIEVIFAIMPNCPDLGWSDQASLNFVEHVRETVGDSPVVDMFTIVPSSGFYDPLHPNREGSRIISSKLADAVKTRQ